MLTLPPPVTFAGTLTDARIKSYSAMETLQVSNADIFRKSQYFYDEHDRPPGRGYSVPPKGKGNDPSRSLEESRRRAKVAVFDIAMCNRFTHMFTWTLDGSLIDRYSTEETYKKVSTFLRNMSQRHGFRYFLIPEYHKDKAIHFHGLCMLGDVEITESYRKNGTLRKTGRGQQVYNMTAWKWGWSTCVPLDDNYERAVSYISKYITKSDEKIFGKWYLSSRNLQKRPAIYPLEHMPYEEYKTQLEKDNQSFKESSVFRDIRIISRDFKKIDSVHTKESRNDDDL